MLQQHQRGLALIVLRLFHLFAPFFLYAFPDIATHEKGTAKYSTSLNENIQRLKCTILKNAFL